MAACKSVDDALALVRSLDPENVRAVLVVALTGRNTIWTHGWDAAGDALQVLGAADLARVDLATSLREVLPDPETKDH